MVLHRFRRHARVLLVLVLLPSSATVAGVMLSAAHAAGDHDGDDHDAAGLVHGHGHAADTPDHDHDATVGGTSAPTAPRPAVHVTTAALPPVAPVVYSRWGLVTLPPHPGPAPQFKILRI